MEISCCPAPSCVGHDLISFSSGSILYMLPVWRRLIYLSWLSDWWSQYLITCFEILKYSWFQHPLVWCSCWGTSPNKGASVRHLEQCLASKICSVGACYYCHLSLVLSGSHMVYDYVSPTPVQASLWILGQATGPWVFTSLCQRSRLTHLLCS